MKKLNIYTCWTNYATVLSRSYLCMNDGMFGDTLSKSLFKMVGWKPIISANMYEIVKVIL